MKTLLILILALSPLTTLGNERVQNNIVECDIVYQDYFFQEVPTEVLTICKNRFIFLTNKEKAKMRQVSIYR